MVCIAIVIIIFIAISRPPVSFQKDTLVTVYSGMSTTDAATVLKGSTIVRSDKWLRFILATRWKGKPIVVGDYIFEKPQSVFSIAYRITHGIYGNSRVKVTFPEGITVKNMGDILTKVIPQFPVSDFLEKAKQQEGFLQRLINRILGFFGIETDSVYDRAINLINFTIVGLVSNKTFTGPSLLASKLC